MIGTFLVFVAAVCAVFRCWWDRLEYYLYKTEIGELRHAVVTTEKGCRAFWFVQYFLRGREFWWWTPTVDVSGRQVSEEEVHKAVAELLHQSLPKRRGHKVGHATLITETGQVDFTALFRQLSGPSQDFYKNDVLDVDVVQAYVSARFDGLVSDCLYVDLCIVPGSVAPFRPIRFDF